MSRNVDELTKEKAESRKKWKEQLELIHQRLGIEEVEDEEIVERIVDVPRMESAIQQLNAKQRAVFTMITEAIASQVKKKLPVNNNESIAVIISGTGKIKL